MCRHFYKSWCWWWMWWSGLLMNKMTVMTCRSRLKGRPPSGTNLQTARHTPHSWKYWSSTGTSEVPPCTWKYHKVSQRQCVIRYTAGCIGHPQGHAILNAIAGIRWSGSWSKQSLPHWAQSMPCHKQHRTEPASHTAEGLIDGREVVTVMAK